MMNERRFAADRTFRLCDMNDPGPGSSHPTRQALEWICNALGGGETIVDVAALPGGMSSAVHRVTLRTASGARTDVVLKRFTDADWLVSEPDLAEREYAALHAVNALGVPAPAALACDPIGTKCGVPALIMSFVPGVPELPGSPDRAWLEKLASPLPALHAAGESAAVALPEYRPYTAEVDLAAPSWSAHPGNWQRGFEILRDPPGTSRSLIHRDYHPCNVLWSDGEVLAVTDWTMACSGPVAIDTAHCRMNLVCLYGVEVADAFERAYRNHRGEPQHPFWDLRCAADMLPLDTLYPGWPALGQTTLRLPQIQKRIDNWVATLVAQLT